jgi:membrane-associated phospholipid phosphatase
MDQSIVAGMKYAIGSERPNHTSFTSFPSGHTSAAFTTAAIASHYYGKKAGIAAYIAAGIVGYSRLDDRAHRFTDVVAGAALGYIVARTVSRRAGFDPDRRLNWNLAVPPGGGVGLSLQIRPPWE